MTDSIPEHRIPTLHDLVFPGDSKWKQSDLTQHHSAQSKHFKEQSNSEDASEYWDITQDVLLSQEKQEPIFPELDLEDSDEYFRASESDPTELNHQQNSDDLDLETPISYLDSSSSNPVPAKNEEHNPEKPSWDDEQFYDHLQADIKTALNENLDTIVELLMESIYTRLQRVNKPSHPENDPDLDHQ